MNAAAYSLHIKHAPVAVYNQPDLIDKPDEQQKLLQGRCLPRTFRCVSSHYVVLHLLLVVCLLNHNGGSLFETYSPNARIAVLACVDLVTALMA